MTRQDLALLRRYYENCDYTLCEYSAGVKLMLREDYAPMWAEAEGCLIVRNRIHGRVFFDYPVTGPEGDEMAALEAIEAWCLDNETPTAISVVPADRAALLLRRYPLFRCIRLKSWMDYVYRASDLRDFPGRHYAGQRNHVNKFRKLYPEARFRVLAPGDEPLIAAFLDEFEQAFDKDSEMARNELESTRELMRSLDPCFLCGGMELDGKLISVSLGEVCGETLHVHVEKALNRYEGVYPATVQAFARCFAGEGIRWLNREDDADDKGLRTSKTQYRPAFMGEKYSFDVQNELEKLGWSEEEPSIETQRLSLSPLNEDDREAYTRLCLDDERNRWWGYDYRKDWNGEPLDTYFLDVARSDYVNHNTLSFAVRLDGKCIGEAVLYRFTGRGSAELGCRIAPEYAGCGYGTEAFAAVADWALYDLQLEAVNAKCYKENAASLRMLQSCMRKTGEDDTFYYFLKTV